MKPMGLWQEGDWIAATAVFLLALFLTIGAKIAIQKQPGTDGMCVEIQVVSTGGEAVPIEVEGGRTDREGRNAGRPVRQYVLVRQP